MIQPGRVLDACRGRPDPIGMRWAAECQTYRQAEGLCRPGHKALEPPRSPDSHERRLCRLASRQRGHALEARIELIFVTGVEPEHGSGVVGGSATEQRTLRKAVGQKLMLWENPANSKIYAYFLCNSGR